MPAETNGAVQPFVCWETVENRVEIGCIIINTGPSTARYGASKRGDASSGLRTEGCNLFFCQTLGIVIGVARRKNVLGRANKCDTAEGGPQVNLACRVESYRVQALASAHIIGTTKRNRWMTGGHNG